jgi:hypothetical protein
MGFLHRLLAAPQRGRDRASKALHSELIATIADHLVKIMIYGQYADHRAKWVKDIARQLRELTFLVSKFSVRKNPDNPADRTRVIKEMHFKSKDVMKALDDETSDAYWRVIEDASYANLNIQDPKGIERGVFSKLGFSIKDAEGPLGKGFRLYYQGELLVDSSN